MSSTSNHDIQALIDHKVKTGITNGGRSLQAIKRSSLKLHEKCFLDSIGSRCDFRGDFLEPIQVSQKEIASDWSMSVRTVIRHALALEEQGYIICHGENGKENSYSLTPKIFQEHEKRLRDKLNKRHGNKVENSLSHRGGDSQSQGGVTLSHRGCDSGSYQYSIPQDFPNYNIDSLLNDILNIDRYPSTRTLFEGLTDIQKEKVLLVLKDNSSRYDYDSMSDNQLVEILKQVLAEGDSGNRPHVLNKELPQKNDSKGLKKSSAPAPQKPLGSMLSGIRGVRAHLSSKLKKGSIPYDGWQEREDALNEFERLHRTHGEHVLNWVDAAIKYNEDKKLKKDKIHMTDLFNDPSSSFEVYMQGVK